MNLWNKFRDGLKRTRDAIVGGLGAALRLTGPVDAATVELLEEALLKADVGPDTADRLIARAKKRVPFCLSPSALTTAAIVLGRALIGRSLSFASREASDETPFQTVRAVFPHTAYRRSLGTRRHAASGYWTVPQSL